MADISVPKEKMVLSDSEARKNYKVRRRSPTKATKKWWSDTQKIEAVHTYFMLGGNLSQTGKMLNIPLQTLNVWKRSEWWKNIDEEIRTEERLQLSNQLKKVVDKSWALVSDRLENGDWVYDQKTGEVRRKPVSLKDANKVAVDAVKLRQDMELVQHHTIATEQIADKLNKLAEAFSNLSKGKPLEPAEDVPFVERIDDALHEEREA